jgi:hypothetical protein
MLLPGRIPESSPDVSHVKGVILRVFDSGIPLEVWRLFPLAAYRHSLRGGYSVSQPLSILLNNIFYFGNKEYLLTEEQYTPLNSKNCVSLFTAVPTSSLNSLH